VGDIAELRQFSLNDDHLEIGGNITLTDLENVCKQAIGHYGDARSQVFQAMHKQIQYFAGRQIRNVGTPAGNLVTASPISDLNPVLMAADAVLVAKSYGNEVEIPMSNFFTGYRKTALPSDAVLASIRVPVTQKNEFFKAYNRPSERTTTLLLLLQH